MQFFSSALRLCVQVAQVGWHTRQFLVGQAVVRSDPLGPSGPSGPTALAAGFLFLMCWPCVGCHIVPR